MPISADMKKDFDICYFQLIASLALQRNFIVAVSKQRPFYYLQTQVCKHDNGHQNILSHFLTQEMPISADMKKDFDICYCQLIISLALQWNFIVAVR